jgi:putative membrane protein
VTLAVLVLLGAVFAANNPEPIAIDIGWAKLDHVSVAVAFACAFAVGWVFGLLCAGAALLKMGAERRKLRRQLRFAETELRSLRSLPLNDAD